MSIVRDPRRLLGLVVLVGILAWRLVDLDLRALYFDEAFTWQLTRFSWAEMAARAQQDVHPLLYYGGLKVWTAVGGDSAFMIRGYSMAWLLVALASAAMFCREAARAASPSKSAGDVEISSSGDDAGVFAMLFLAACPLLFRHSQEARMYTQVAGLVMLTSWLLLRALRERERPARWWAGYGLAAAALAHTHNFGLFTLAAQFAYLAGVLAFPSGWPDPRARRVAATGACGAALLVAALYLPWVPTLLKQQRQVAEDYWMTDVGNRSPLDLALWEKVAVNCLVPNGVDQGVPFLQGEGTAAMLGDELLLASAALLAWLAWRRDRAGLYLAAAVVLPVDLAIAASYQLNRSMIESRFFMPSFVLLLVGLAVALGRVRSGKARWALAALIAINLGYATSEYQKTLDLPNRPEFRGLAEHIAKNVRPGDLVVCAKPFDYFPLKYHARGRFTGLQAKSPMLLINHYCGGPVYQDSDFIAWDDVVARRSGRIWVVSVQSEIKGLEHPDDWKLVESLTFPEAIRWRGAAALELWEPRQAPAKTAHAGAGTIRP